MPAERPALRNVRKWASYVEKNMGGPGKRIVRFKTRQMLGDLLRNREKTRLRPTSTKEHFRIFGKITAATAISLHRLNRELPPGKLRKLGGLTERIIRIVTESNVKDYEAGKWGN